MQHKIIYSFANKIESRNDITENHFKRTSAYVKEIVNELDTEGIF